MRLFKSSKNENELAVGPELAAVLPDDPKPWYRTRHLILLNLMLIVPMLSPGVYGYDGSMVNGLQTLPQWWNYFGQPKSSVLGALNAMYPLGKLVGVLPATFIGDRWGRKVPLTFGLVVAVIGAALQGAAQNLPMFIVARWIVGFACAFISQPAPILVTELAYPTQRGKVTGLYYTFYWIGAILAAWITYGTFRMPSSWSWRIPSILQGLIPFIQLLFVWFVPESPRWYIAHDDIPAARRILTKWHAGGDETSRLVDFEMAEMISHIEAERLIASQSSYVDLIRTAPNRKRTFISFVVGFWGTWGGIAVISYYLTLVLKSIGITKTSDQALINGMLQLFNYLCSVGAGVLIDRIGRRTLWLTCALGMLLSYIGWTILASVFARTGDHAVGNSVIAFVFIYSFFYDIGFTPLLQTYAIEIFPYTLRGRGFTVSLVSTYVGLIIGQFVNPIALGDIGWKYYIVFCILIFMLLVFVYLFFPETSGKSLEEIAICFGDEKTVDVDGKLRVEMGDEETKEVDTRVEDVKAGKVE
ncbi:general substrate transporter [Lophium mytilinum]|uniref:General substrate transporter n=1 Tax=Lophium mytilinum TaxID=390894 RepID=A0A6A6RG63_9PEZI|nr:general substrate transporter [Lophium mytilinum]